MPSTLLSVCARLFGVPRAYMGATSANAFAPARRPPNPTSPACAPYVTLSVPAVGRRKSVAFRRCACARRAPQTRTRRADVGSRRRLVPRTRPLCASRLRPAPLNSVDDWASGARRPHLARLAADRPATATRSDRAHSTRLACPRRLVSRAAPFVPPRRTPPPPYAPWGHGQAPPTREIELAQLFSIHTTHQTQKPISSEMAPEVSIGR